MTKKRAIMILANATYIFVGKVGKIFPDSEIL